MKHRMLPAAAGILLSTALCTCLVGCGKSSSETDNSSSLPDAPITTAVSAVTNAAESTAVSTAQPDKPSDATVATTAGAENESPILAPGTGQPGEELPVLTIPTETNQPGTTAVPRQTDAPTTFTMVTIPSTGIELPFVPYEE